MTGQVILESAALAARNDEADLEKLLENLAREHAQLIYRIAYCVLRNHHDAEDVAQDVFLRALRHKRKLRSLAQPKAWLARIAWRAAIERAGSRGRLAEADLDVVIAGLHSARPDPERLAANEQMQGLVDQMLASLPAKLRAAVLLSAIEELNSREIAEVLEIPETSVRTRIMRGRALLREKLKARLGKSYA